MSQPHELVHFDGDAFEASNKHNELPGRTSSVDGVLTFMEQIILSLPTNVSMTCLNGQ